MIQHVILDLDHTLICATENGARYPQYRQWDFENYVIHERPHLAEFLRQLEGKYTISVWTAASADYGNFIINKILQPYLKQPIRIYLHSEQCYFSSREYGIIKHLDLLHHLDAPSLGLPNFRRNNTIIIDDNEGIRAQNNMVYIIPPFEVEKGDADRELLIALKKLDQARVG